MEKISGILPASPRITNVNLRDSGTARSGMPSYGRPQLDETGSARRHTQTNQMHAMNKVMDPHVDIVDKISKEFFMQKTEAPKTQLDVDMDNIFGPDSDLNPMTETEAPMAAAPIVAEPVDQNQSEDLDVPLAGGYLDVSV